MLSRSQNVGKVWERFRSCASCLGGRPTQAIDPGKDAGEDPARQRCLGELEYGIAGVAHQPGAGLDQPFAQRGQRPCLDLVGRRQRTQEFGKVIGQRVKLEPDGVRGEAHV